MALGFFNVDDKGNPILSDEDITSRRKLAQELMKEGTQYGPVQHWTQGLARVLQGAAGSYEDANLDKARNANSEYAGSKIAGILGGADTPAAASSAPSAPSASATPNAAVTPVGRVPAFAAGGGNPAAVAGAMPNPDIKSGIAATAQALGVNPTDLATAISYETAGTFDPTKAGPTTQWGQHRGLIQFGEPQAQKYGVDWKDPVGSQLGANGAVAKYLTDAGVKPGMGLMDIYSAINAGRVGRYGASDANNGGAPGTVADKVNQQMAGHRANAEAMFGSGNTMAVAPQPPAMAQAPAQQAIASAAPAQGEIPQMQRTPFTPADPTLAQKFPDIMSPPAGGGGGGGPVPPVPQQAQAIPAPQQTPAVAAASQGLTKQQQIAQFLMDPRVSDKMKQQAMPIIAPMIAGEKMQFQTDKEGNIIALDPSGRMAPRVVHKAATTPQWGVIGEDQSGNKQYGFIDPVAKSVTKYNLKGDGDKNTVTLPSGEVVPVPDGVDPNEFSKKFADDAVKQITAAPNVINQAKDAINSIDAIEKHPALSSTPNAKSWIPGVGVGGILPGIPGTAQRDFRNRLDQLKGKNFLEAYNTLRGGGAITEVEGKKATDAMARLDSAQSEGDFRQALGELKTVLGRGMERAQKALGKAPQAQQPPAAPVQAAPQPAPPDAMKNARQAPDGKFYVPDPARPGKYLEVRP